MNRATGAQLDRREHIIQSIGDILTTRIGTRVMRRQYGSLLPELVDQPANDATRLRLYAATAMALISWEPRIRLHRVSVQDTHLQGVTVLDLDCTLVDDNERTRLRVALDLGASV